MEKYLYSLAITAFLLPRLERKSLKIKFNKKKRLKPELSMDYGKKSVADAILFEIITFGST